MARKHLLQNVLGPDAEQKASAKRTNYAMRGASGKMKASLDTLAENAKKMLDGETIVEIDTDLIDGSFVKDRLSTDDEAYDELKATIEESGQNTPVLLRPHPEADGRYMIVFGHRRVRVARELHRSVRAVIKSIDDVAHVLAQGQENSARSDLSFIEKALFAKRLLDIGQGKEIIQAALTVDATLLSRLLSVSQKIDETIIEAIGPAKSIGRDRWEAFKKLVVLPKNRALALEELQTDHFASKSSDERFELLLNVVSNSGAKKKRAGSKAAKMSWSSKSGMIKGVYGTSGKSFNLALSDKDGVEFGKYISENLENLYEDFRKMKEEMKS